MTCPESTWHIVTVLGQDEGYTVKYTSSPEARENS